MQERLEKRAAETFVQLTEREKNDLFLYHIHGFAVVGVLWWLLCDDCDDRW
jgi:hypothetical protein